MSLTGLAGTILPEGLGMLHGVERYLGFNLTEKRRGGASGGRTILSEKGQQIVLAYNNLRHESYISPNRYLFACPVYFHFIHHRTINRNT
ncbi:MAG TPA: hypothetical protein PLN46_10580 [Bacteroidales bacterium]|nr:hypothetical protein [Bacteroidales bacterium]